MAEIKKKRGKGRPLRETSIAILAEKNLIDYKEEIVKAIPKARETLIALMDTGTEKVKENVAKFVLEEAKTFNREYLAEEEDESAETESQVAEVTTKTDIPFSKEIRKIGGN